MYKIIAPLYCMQTKTKKFIYGMNIYRNAHYRTLSSVKIKYKAEIQNQIDLLPQLDIVHLKYVLYPKTRRKMDLANVLSIHSKFFEDALQDKIPDDDYHHIPQITYSFGKVDPINPRVEIHIIEIT